MFDESGVRTRWYHEVFADGVMTTALLDRLLHHARVFNLNGESYRIRKRREEEK